jgi:hypothetical protein
MPETLLLVSCEETAPGEYTQTSLYYTGILTQYLLTGSFDEIYREERITTFSCSPYAIPSGTIVEDRCVPGRGSDTRQARLIGRTGLFGLVSFDPYEYNAASCPIQAAFCDLRLDSPVLTPPTSPSQSDGEIIIGVLTSHPPVQYVLQGVNNTTGQFTGRFTGLSEGTYTIFAEDDLGCTAQFGPLVLSGRNPSTRYWLRFQDYEVRNDPQDPTVVTGFERNGTYYDFTTRLAVLVTESVPTLEPPYSRPTSELVDSYYLSDSVTFRQVYHDGSGDIRFVDTVVPPSGIGTGLRFVNIIKTDIDYPDTTGMVLLEATNDNAGGLITYTRAATNQQNTTGAFSGLTAGAHTFRATDASGQSTEETITMEDRYRPKWVLLSTDPFMQPSEVTIYERDYEGEVISMCGDGQGEALTRSWDGQSDPAAELPELVGQGVTVVLRTSNPLAFEVLSTGDDRRHRLDVRSGESKQLEFRGYTSPDLFRVSIHEGLPAVTINASCGLGTLRDTLFLNHVGAALAESGRWSKLHTLLHCLSRCDVNLPLYVGVQLREKLMRAADETLAAVYADRSAYGKTPVLAEVVEALLRPYKALVWQARGAWWVASELDLALLDDAEWTHYTLAGEVATPSLPPSKQGLDLWAIKYPGSLTQERHLVWVSPGAEQATVAAAKLVQANVKLQLRENNLPGGELQDWNATNTLPLPGWSEGPAQRVLGPKAGTYALELLVFNVLTAPMQTFPGADYSPIVLKFKARSVGVVPSGGPTPTATLRVQVLTDGVPDPNELTFQIPHGGPDGKFQEYSSTLPATTTGASVRLRISAIGLAPVELANVFLSILPALVEWPDSDQVTVVRPDGVLKAPDVELVHADAPRLNLIAPVQKMDVLAWRHALSLRDGTATTSWVRPGVRQPAPLLETAALDRLELRQSAQRTLSGSLLGYNGVGAMSFGQLVLSPDAPGRLLMVVSCEVQQFSGVARVVLRAIGSAPDAILPIGSRVTTSGSVRVLPSGGIRVLA